MKRFLRAEFFFWLPVAAIVAVVGLAGITLAQNISSCPTLNCWHDGSAPTALGDTVTVGGALNVESGGTLNIEAGGALQQAGVAISLQGTDVEVVAATNVIAAAESGTTFFLNDATEFASTLPPVSSAGQRYTFIVTGAPAGASYTIGSAGGADVINIVAMTGEAASVALVAVGQDVLTFVDAQAVVGDWVYCISDGTNWQCSGAAAVAAGLTSGQS